MGRLLVDLQSAWRPSRLGGKAGALVRLVRLGFDVPRAWALSRSAVRRLAADPARHGPSIAEQLDPSSVYAVRSSADAEDQRRHSFAGRFQTLLDVHADDVPKAVVSVGLLSDGEAITSYADAMGVRAPGGQINVIVQEMVHPAAAGVVFSRNPVSGIKETVIEAVAGSAENLLAGRMRPERWVRKRGQWVLTPDDPVLPPEVANLIADGAERLDKAFGYSVDAEWAWDDSLWWLQVRPVTAGAQAAVYSSKLARDMLPGIILPLVWSINGPLKSAVFVRFLEDVFGPLDVRPEDLSALFHYRMYINIGALSKLFAEFGLPEESLELLAGMERGASMPRMPHPTMRSVRRVPHLAHSMWRFSRFDREIERDLPRLWDASRRFAARPDPDSCSVKELLERIEALQELMGETSYLHLVTLMIMQMFSMRFRSSLERSGALSKGEVLQLPCAEVSDDDVGRALMDMARLVRQQPADVQAMVRDSDLEGLRASSHAGDFTAAFDRFMDKFGHLSDSGVNFSSIPWSEQPECVLGMIAAGVDNEAARRNEQTCEQFERDHDLSRRQARALRRVLRYQAHRDRTSALYTYSYSQFRPLVLALGRHLEAAGALGTLDDVFYLTLEEIERVSRGALSPDSARALVVQRREDVSRASEGEPPEIVVGDVAELIEMPRRRVLRGTPSSRGSYTGPVVVCRSIGDLGRISEGDVVVVPFSDASWTPLFTRAGAIVAESGGVLCHSAILARELGLPSVVSVRGALTLADGSLVSVDGFQGTVTIVSAAS